METVNNIATAAAKAVWGDNTRDGQEPVSGQQGDTSKGEPFDKGNIEEPSTAASKDTTGTTSTSSKNADTTNAAEFSKTTGTAAESDDVPDNKQTNLKAKDTANDTSHGQNDTRDPEDPQTHPKNNPTDVDDTGDGVKEGQKLDGPGPKPLIDIAKKNGGDAGADETTEGDAKPGSAEDDEDPNSPRAKSKGEGTGEQYVKSSGLKADGGDFDATKPGAGREADRLLEEKGVHHGPQEPKADPSAGADSSGTGTADKEKKSFGAKIKEKLHRH